jgi:transcriptional regulator with XRE-family HTH domain
MKPRRMSEQQWHKFQMQYGAVLKDLRTKAGLSRLEMAQKSKICVAVIAAIEQGKGNPLLGTMEKIAQTLKTTISHMLVLAKKKRVKS